ncbi:hypothetical protein [Mycobacterium sp. SMC-4]|uniref:hypothetical protein n=1 Tax=Mycobacterium sp. SMC-4 TaxID=2857059 RepID=UPI003D081EC4
MTATVAPRSTKALRPHRRSRWTVLLALLASTVLMLAIAPGLAMVGALIVLAVGALPWERTVDDARAAGLVE